MRTLSEITLAVDAHTVERALEWLEATGRAADWPDRTRFKLRLCLDETLTNITMYGYADMAPGETGPRVNLTAAQDGRKLLIELTDNGRPFDPTSRQPRALDDSLDTAQIGGHGIRLLKHYLDDMKYERCDGWNRLLLFASVDDSA